MIQKGKIKRIMLLTLCFVTFALSIMACKSKKSIPVFKYDVNDDDTATIIGLTDKGKLDSKLNVPDEIDGHKIVSIGREAFRDDTCVTEVVIEEGVESIAENVFLNCTSLKDISFPSSIKEIGTSAFKNTAWEKQKLKEADGIVVNSILIEVKSDIKEYTVPEDVNYIASGVFYNNSVIEQIHFGTKIEKIGSFAFSGCSSLNEIVLPDNLKTIGYCAFSDIAAADIKIPDGVEKIENEAFLNVAHIEANPELEGFPWGAKSSN